MKRKATRMFSREQRRAARAETLERARHVTQDDIDLNLIGMIAPGYITPGEQSPARLAEVWFELMGEPDPTDFEAAARDALARQLERLIGEPICIELAEVLVSFNE